MIHHSIHSQGMSVEVKAASGVKQLLGDIPGVGNEGQHRSDQRCSETPRGEKESESVREREKE